MKSWERRIVPGGLALAGLLFLFAAVKPSFTGQSLNTTFFVLAIALLILSFVLWRKIGAATDVPKG